MLPMEFLMIIPPVQLIIKSLESQRIFLRRIFIENIYSKLVVQQHPEYINSHLKLAYDMIIFNALGYTSCIIKLGAFAVTFDVWQ